MNIPKNMNSSEQKTSVKTCSRGWRSCMCRSCVVIAVLICASVLGMILLLISQHDEILQRRHESVMQDPIFENCEITESEWSYPCFLSDFYWAGWLRYSPEIFEKMLADGIWKKTDSSTIGQPVPAKFLERYPTQKKYFWVKRELGSLEEGAPGGYTFFSGCAILMSPEKGDTYYDVFVSGSEL